MAGLRAGGWTCLGAVGLSILIGLVSLWGLGIIGQNEEKDGPPEDTEVRPEIVSEKASSMGSP